jgi:hypothetical protein
MRPFACLGLLVTLCGLAVADGDQDNDLSLIPHDVASEPVAKPSAPSSVTASLHAEDAVAVAAPRDSVVAFPSPSPFAWQNRSSVDGIVEWRPVAWAKLALSDRLDLVEQQAQPLWSRQLPRNALREVYATLEPIDGGYLEVGRINVRNGSALGFNPTDFFKARTLVEHPTIDPSALSRNRLGTLMVRAELIRDGWAASLLVAPKLYAPSAITSRPVGIDPRFDATNSTDQLLATASTTFGDLSAQTLVDLARDRSKLGVNLTEPIGKRVIAYGEWSGGFDTDLIARAIAYGRDTGTLPAGTPPPIPTRSASSFREDIAVGGSWTIAKVTLNVEYHYHQTGLSRGDWNRWFDAGIDHPSLAAELWYIRGYANDQREPVARHAAFVRLAWPKAFVDHLELDGLAFANLADGSTLSQITASYYASDAWTVAAALTTMLGSARSEQGSLPQSVAGVFELVRYL